MCLTQRSVSELARLRRDAVTVPKHRAVGDSQENIFIERAVRTVEEMVRSLKLDPEARISQKLNITLKLILWLVEFVPVFLVTDVKSPFFTVGASVFYSYCCLSRRSPKSGGRDAGEMNYFFFWNSRRTLHLAGLSPK